MNKSFAMSRTIVISVALSTAAFVGIAFAAVRWSVTQQNIKTLHSTFTYQDVIAAPSIGGNPNLRLLKIINIPANTEIVSAYFKINTSFTDASSNNLLIDGQLGVYNKDSSEFLISQGDLYNIGLRRPNLISGLSEVVISDQLRELKFLINDTDYNGDIDNLTSGVLELHVNYLTY